MRALIKLQIIIACFITLTSCSRGQMSPREQVFISPPPLLHGDCPAGHIRAGLPDLSGRLSGQPVYTNANGCAPIEEALDAVTGRVYWVDSMKGNDETGTGTKNNAWRTIAEANTTINAGDGLILRGGTYRETIVPKSGASGKSKTTYAAYTGETVVISGAEIVPARLILASSRERAVRNEYQFRWNVVQPCDPPRGAAHFPCTPGTPSASGTEDVDYDNAMRREQFIVNGVAYTAAYRLSDLTGGKFFVADADGGSASKIVYIVSRGERLTDETNLVEGAARDWLVDGGEAPLINDVRFINLIFRYSANKRQSAIVRGLKNGVFWEEGEISWNSSTGARLYGGDGLFRGIKIYDNGILGFAGVPYNGSIIEYLDVRRNNRKLYDADDEAGGGKLVYSHDYTFRWNYAADNEGPGFWWDIGNRDVLIDGNFTANNRIAGIFLELDTYRLIVTNNVATQTRKRRGGSYGNGIQLTACQSNIIAYNTSFNNAGAGLEIRDDGSRSVCNGKNCPLPPTGKGFHQIYNNVFAANAEAALRLYMIDDEQLRSTAYDGNIYTNPSSQLNRAGRMFQVFYSNRTSLHTDSLMTWQAALAFRQNLKDLRSKVATAPVLIDETKASGWQLHPASAATGAAINVPFMTIRYNSRKNAGADVIRD